MRHPLPALPAVLAEWAGGRGSGKRGQTDQSSDAARGDGVGNLIEDQASKLISAISVERDPAEADDDAGELADPAHVYQPNDDDDDRA